jgi:hypothetical protein
MDNRQELSRMRSYLIFATALFALELMLGVGLIGIAGVFVAAIVLFLPSREWPNVRRRLLVVAVFICVATATFGWLVLNTRLAKRNAAPIIEACKRFRVEHERYPSSLSEVVPKPLSSLPAARYTLVANRFVYDPDTPALCFAAMFHGVFCYDFPTQKWVTNE